MSKRIESQPERWYPVDLPLSYKVPTRPDLPTRGTGHVHAMSRRKIAVSLSLPRIDVGRIELSIGWPVLLNGVTPLNLFVKGTLVWDVIQRTHIVHIMHHEFKLAGRRQPGAERSREETGSDKLGYGESGAASAAAAGERT